MGERKKEKKMRKSRTASKTEGSVEEMVYTYMNAKVVLGDKMTKKREEREGKLERQRKKRDL